MKKSFEAVDRESEKDLKKLYEECVSYRNQLSSKQSALTPKIKKYEEELTELDKTLQENKSRVKELAEEIKSLNDAGQSDKLSIKTMEFTNAKFKVDTYKREKIDLSNTKQLLFNLKLDISQALEVLGFIIKMLERSLDRLGVVDFNPDEANPLFGLSINTSSFGTKEKEKLKNRVRQISKDADALYKQTMVSHSTVFKGVDKSQGTHWTLTFRDTDVRPKYFGLCVTKCEGWIRDYTYNNVTCYSLEKLIDRGLYDILVLVMKELPVFLKEWKEKIEEKNSELNDTIKAANKISVV